VAQEDQLACGENYAGTRPTLTAVLVRLSRKRAAGVLGIQSVHASVATGEVELRSAPLTAVSELPLTLTGQLGYGAIAPDTPHLGYPATTYGAGTRLWGVQVVYGGSPLYSESWEQVTERTGVAIRDGRTYTLVFIGPNVGLTPRYFWNASRVVVVDNDPTDDQ
jgi:hypothetical protein